MGFKFHLAAFLKRLLFTIIVGILLAAAVIFLAWYIPAANGDRNRRDAQSLHDQARLPVQGGMKTTLNTYKITMGVYSSTEEGLDALVRAPAGKVGLWKGPYIGLKIPLDPWDEAYRYLCPGAKKTFAYDLWSNGPNGSPPGAPRPGESFAEFVRGSELIKNW